jgi:2-polyprenyl-3-methyl-5-hydroxy-6-metoxy-1,4-benzoquinol methylase
MARLPRVTSDCKPFRPGGRLATCTVCGGIQAIPDERWRSDVAEIYGAYEPYHQSGGVEQSVFDATTGAPRRRSALLATRFAGMLSLGPTGHLLDVGCGNGAMLSAISELLPGWSLFGQDLDDRHLESLARIPRFADLHTRPLPELTDRFDVVTMSHSLEHMPAPRAVLAAVRALISPHGRLFVQVPDAQANPFDLVVADHLCHFAPLSLSRLVDASGLTVELTSAEWIAKEISLLARPRSGANGPQDTTETGTVSPVQLRERIAWLTAVLGEATQAASGAMCFALFGTSIAATWLFASLGARVDFFVDEDPARVGGRHLGRPVLRPSEVPAGTSVYLALVPAIAARVRQRLSGLPVTFHSPPELA